MIRATLIALLTIALGFCLAPLLTAHEEPTGPAEDIGWVWPWEEDAQPTVSLAHEFGVERGGQGRGPW